MNALVLCSGHNPPECLYPVDGVIAYQAHQDLPPINPYSTIGVIGCSLTAIDAIVELMERLGRPTSALYRARACSPACSRR